MDINLSLQSFKQSLGRFLHRFHVLIFTILILGGLAVVILLLNNIVVRSGQSEGYQADTGTTSFDQATIKKIEELETRGQSSPPPAGVRTNPFVE